MIRRLIPYALGPLAVLATGLSSSMWLRAFPAATLAIPLFGSAAMSVAVAFALVLVSRRAMWLTVPIGIAIYLVYALVVVLRDPLGFAALTRGFVNGPAQLLSFALPLVSPRSLMIWPVALCWLAGLLAGESLARSRLSLLPYATWLVVFGVGYAGGSRAMGPDATVAHRVDLAVGAGLLLVLVLLRVAQGWLAQEESSEAAGRVVSTDDATALNLVPLQRIATGAVTAVVVVVVAGYLASTSTFAGPPTVLKRVPKVTQADPTTPMAYVAALRPIDRTSAGTPLFDLTVDGQVPGYVGLASVDYYDGDSWTFDRSFTPSGGVLPADTDPELDPSTAPVTQSYDLRSTLITRTPWIPTIYRPAKVSGIPVSIDAASGMVVPTGQLSSGTRYQVRSVPAAQTLMQLPASWLPATSAPPVDSQLPGQVRSTLSSVIEGFVTETGQSAASANAFLQAVVGDLQSNYLLTDPSQFAASSSPSRSASAQATKASRSTKAKPSKGSPAARPSVTASADTAIGGTSFSAVLAAILGQQRSGTPEQYATLVTLMARDLGVPARIVSGFRITNGDGSHQLKAGSYTVTTKDAYSWVEIPVRGLGWMVLDPSPSRYASTEAQPSVGVTKSPTPSRTPTQAALVTAANGGHAVAPKSAVRAAPPHHSHLWLTLLLLVIALAALAVLAVVLILGRHWLRRQRRRRVADARGRVIAAWQETLDVLTESGLGDLRTLTGAEVGQATESRFGVAAGQQVRRLSGTAEQAAFSSQAVLVARDAEQAWRSQALIRRSVRRSLPWRDRVAASLRYNSSRRRAGVRLALRPRRRVPARRAAGRRRAGRR